MELTKNFTELNAIEMNEIDGGFIITLTTGAAVGLCIFGGGFLAGLIFA